MPLVDMVSESTPIREERPYAAYVGLREVHYSRPDVMGQRLHFDWAIKKALALPPTPYRPKEVKVQGDL